MTEILAEKFYTCKRCGWYGRWDKILWKADDGLIEHKRRTCPRCGNHWFDEKLVEYVRPKPVDEEKI